MSGFMVLTRFRRPNGKKTMEDLEFLIAAIHAQNDRLDRVMRMIEQIRNPYLPKPLEFGQDKADDVTDGGHP